MSCFVTIHSLKVCLLDIIGVEDNNSALMTSASSVSVVVAVLVTLVVICIVLVVVYFVHRSRREGGFDPGRNIDNGLYFTNNLYAEQEPEPVYEEMH